MAGRNGRKERPAAIAACAFLSLSACTHPIETRIDNSGGGKAAGFTIAPSSPASPMEVQAQNEVRRHLLSAGFTESVTGPLFVQVGLADRPADIALSLGRNATAQSLSAASRSKRRLFDPCEKRDYRLTVSITDMSSSAQSYAGSASERHCRSGMSDVLPHLARAMLADLGGPPRKIVEQRAPK